MRDTIFAPATAAGRAALAVVRVSGPDAAATLQALAGRMPVPRRATLRMLRDIAGHPIDEALVLWMPGPASFTGEDCLELQAHGGPAVVEAICAALASVGARLADPGEFTRRAFEAGRLDLAQAEAVADLVDAQSQAQRRQAVAQLGGALSHRHERWRELLLDALGYIEAAVDFPEDDVPAGIVSHALAPIAQALDEIRGELASHRGERVRTGLSIALVGAPNVGKSSLLNALAGRDAAIVSTRPGTTRDIVEVSLHIDGHDVLIADTAGMRSPRGGVEAAGVERARIRADTADVRLAVADLSRRRSVLVAQSLLRPGDILVLNKADLVATSAEHTQGVRISAMQGDVGALQEALKDLVAARTAGVDFPAVTRARHRHHLGNCAGHLTRAKSSMSAGAELAAEDVRAAIRELERVTGRTNPEAVLDRVFAKFCIGK